MRTVDEVRELSKDVELSENDNNIAAQVLLPYHRLLFVVAAMEDDLDDNAKLQLFKDCVGKSDEEIIKLAYDATTTDDAKASETAQAEG